MALIYVYTYGSSKQVKKELLLILEKMMSLEYAVSSVLGLSLNKRKVEEEQAYYSALTKIIGEILS